MLQKAMQGDIAENKKTYPNATQLREILDAVYKKFPLPPGYTY